LPADAHSIVPRHRARALRLVYVRRPSCADTEARRAGCRGMAAAHRAGRAREASE
jgi:hypothetical protein